MVFQEHLIRLNPDIFLESINQKINATIALEVDEDELITRLLDRGKLLIDLMIRIFEKLKIDLTSIIIRHLY